MNAEQVSAKCEREIRNALPASMKRSAPVGDLSEMWRLGLEPGTEDILDIVETEDGEVRVIRYDLKQAFVGAVALLTGPSTGFLAGLAVVAGVIALSGARTPLSAEMAIIVAALAGTAGHEMPRARLEDDYRKRLSEVAGRNPTGEDFAATVALMESQEIVMNIGSKVRLNEVCHLNMKIF